MKTRQIAFDALTSLKRDFYRFAFPGFFDPEPAVEPKSLDDSPLSGENDLMTAMLKRHVQFRNCRRHAGDFLALHGPRPSDLPRQSYHALTGPDGTDRGLLRNELLAYADFEATGGFMLLDALLEGERAIWSYPERNVLLLVLGKDAGAKFLHKMTGKEVTPEQVPPSLLTAVEAEFSDFSAERVLDLRQSDARAWFYDVFSDFSRLSGPLDPMLADALAHERPAGPSFEYMLPTLCSTPRGGGWQSQVIGIVMRRLGVDALVFPSARCDPEVQIKDGEMIHWRGWNIVDYRGAPPPVDIEESGVLIGLVAVFGPEGAKAPYRGRRLDTAEVSRTRQVLILGDPFWTDISRAVLKVDMSSEGPYAGSFAVDGLDDAVNAAWFKAFTGEPMPKPEP